MLSGQQKHNIWLIAGDFRKKGGKDTHPRLQRVEQVTVIGSLELLLPTEP